MWPVHFPEQCSPLPLDSLSHSTKRVIASCRVFSCRSPWSDSDDLRLRKFMAPFVNDEFPPWPLIATRCNFGHNSGSCEKRWKEIQVTKNTKWDAGKRFEFGGAKAGGEVTGFKGSFSTVYKPN